jgi:UrcA family protein
MKRTLLAAALALSTLAAPAFAATGDFKMDVKFSRANLATAEGASAEYARIRDQVAERCADVQPVTGSRLKIGREFQVSACTERTLTAAVRDIGNANLTAAHKAAKG